MADEDKKTSKLPFIVVVVGLLMQVILVISLVSPTYLKNSMNNELQSMSDVYGEDEALSIYMKASDQMEELLYDSGFILKLRNVVFPKEYLYNNETSDGKVFNTKFWDGVDNVLNNIVLNVQYVLMRIYGFIPWAFLTMIILSASIISGYYQREIKKHGFEYSSPMRHGIAKRFIYFLPCLICMFLLMPIAIPVYFFPIVIVLFSFNVTLLIANTIKRV